jgi:magnesium-transporting ATPase (P-type)
MANGEENLAQQLENVPQMRYSIPFCCFHIKPGRIFLHRCKQMILQFVICKPVLAIATFILELTETYDEGNLSPSRGYLYISILYNISITISLYFLVLFYEATKGILAPFKPISKFLCIKAVIFFSFWQGVVIAVMVHFNLVLEGRGDWTTSQVATGTQNFIICLEMLPCSIAYALTFGYKTFKKKNGRRATRVAARGHLQELQGRGQHPRCRR